MSGPRHLWSGDWEEDSAARAADLAAQRARAPQETPEPEPEQPAPARQPRRTLRERLTAFRRRHARRLRLALLTGILAILSLGAIYAVASAFTGGSTTNKPAATQSQHAWLGIEMISDPSGGVLVSRVFPGSPAQKAGIKPGDEITQIDTQPIAVPSIASATIDGLAPGDHVDIQVQRGQTTFTAHVTLTSRPKSVR